MSLASRIKEIFSEDLPEAWVQLTDERQIDQALIRSREKPVIIFKHSVSCGLSAHAKYRLKSAWDELSHDVYFYFLDLINFRHISNRIAEDLNVIHQSPQIIGIVHGEAVFNASHHGVSIERLNEALSKRPA